MKLQTLAAVVAAGIGAVFLLSNGSMLLSNVLGLGGQLGGGSGKVASLPQGQRLASPGIALAGGGKADVREVSSFFAPTAADELPATTVTLAEMSGCGFRPPRPGEVVGNILVGRGGLPTAISAMSRRSLAELALARIRATRDGPAVAPVEDPAPMGAVDVFVTERNAPVYLILQSEGADVLWNLQPSPGARIAHVAVIAAGQTALVAPGGIRAEVLRVAEHPDCAVAPARKPDPEWRIFREGARLEGHEAAFAAYNAWFSSRFGIAADANLIGFEETSHVLVGPVPAARDKVMQNRLAGATVAVTDADLAAIGAGEARSGRLAAAADRLAALAAGGDLARAGFAELHREE